jgi:hypothetical protein
MGVLAMDCERKFEVVYEERHSGSTRVVCFDTATALHDKVVRQQLVAHGREMLWRADHE